MLTRNTNDGATNNSTILPRVKELSAAEGLHTEGSIWWKEGTVRKYKYSCTRLIRTRLFRIPRYFKLETISLGSLLQSFTIGYFELPPFRTIFHFSCKFEIAGFNCVSNKGDRVSSGYPNT